MLSDPITTPDIKPIILLKTKRGKRMEKKLYKSQNKMLDGVCAGIGEYFGIDPTVVRLAWVLFSLLGGSGILAYIIAAIIIPNRN